MMIINIIKNPSLTNIISIITKTKDILKIINLTKKIKLFLLRKKLNLTQKKKTKYVRKIKPPNQKKKINSPVIVIKTSHNHQKKMPTPISALIARKIQRRFQVWNSPI